jgi:hypothetical protein
MWLVCIVCSVVVTLYVAARCGQLDADARRSLFLNGPSVAQVVHVCAHVLTGGAACDFAMCVHWLPAGWLWSERLPAWAVGALGVASTLAGIRLP